MIGDLHRSFCLTSKNTVRRVFSGDYHLLAKSGFSTSENEHFKVCDNDLTRYNYIASILLHPSYVSAFSIRLCWRASARAGGKRRFFGRGLSTTSGPNSRHRRFLDFEWGVFTKSRESGMHSRLFFCVFFLRGRFQAVARKKPRTLQNAPSKWDSMTQTVMLKAHQLFVSNVIG